jgi:RND family efflux transporter MFP subunit
MQRAIASLILCLLCTTVSAARYPAELDWSKRLVLSTPVSGIVSATPVAAGAQVDKGQLLVQLDERPFRSALRDATAQLHKHALNRDEAERELERTRELYERRVISVHDLQLQEIAFAGAQSDYESAQAALDAASLHLEYSSIRAPFSGLVLELAVAPGETVVNTQEATPMVTLASNHPMTAVARIEQSDLGRLAPGQPATVDVGGKRYSGKVVRLSAEPDTSGRYTLIVSFEPGDASLRAGISAHIETSP